MKRVLAHLFGPKPKEEPAEPSKTPGVKASIEECGRLLDELGVAQILYKPEDPRYQHYEYRIEAVLMVRDRLMDML